MHNNKKDHTRNASNYSNTAHNSNNEDNSENNNNNINRNNGNADKYTNSNKQDTTNTRNGSHDDDNRDFGGYTRHNDNDTTTISATINTETTCYDLFFYYVPNSIYVTNCTTTPIHNGAKKTTNHTHNCITTH